MSTLAFLTNNRVYRAALNRILSVWIFEPFATVLLEQLISKLSLDKNQGNT